MRGSHKRSQDVRDRIQQMHRSLQPKSGLPEKDGVIALLFSEFPLRLCGECFQTLFTAGGAEDAEGAENFELRRPARRIVS